MYHLPSTPDPSNYLSDLKVFFITSLLNTKRLKRGQSFEIPKSRRKSRALAINRAARIFKRSSFSLVGSRWNYGRFQAAALILDRASRKRATVTLYRGKLDFNATLFYPG